MSLLMQCCNSSISERGRVLNKLKSWSVFIISCDPRHPGIATIFINMKLMMVVDYGGSISPTIAHAPWNGLHLADLVMPFFLFIAGLSISLAYKKVGDKMDATNKAMAKGVKLFVLGVFLQGGYLHGAKSLTYGVDILKIRWMGILQISKQSSSFSASNSTIVHEVKCGLRGDLSPACNAAGMIDRYVLGISHLYAKPAYGNLKECNKTKIGIPESSPSWCHAPFDPEGLLGSLTAAVTCIIGLQFGHILVHMQDHKERLHWWSVFSIYCFMTGVLLAILGVPMNKSLYTVSYTLVTSACAGFTFCAFYLLVDMWNYRWLMSVLEWIGVHSLSIFILVTSNIAIVVLQGFYLGLPKNNIIHWIISCVVRQ